MQVSANEQRDITRLLLGHRWAAIAVMHEQKPMASMVAFATDVASQGVLLLLSDLALHTRCLRDNGEASLVVSEPDTGQGDPQTLKRLSINGSVIELARDEPAFVQGREIYTQRLPDSARLFTFGDFRLFRMQVDAARYVGGFGAAHRLTAAQLWACLTHSNERT